MRKLLLVTVVLLLSSLGLATILLSSESTTIEEGGILPIKVQILDENGNPVKTTLMAEASLGGFEELELTFEGLEVDGETTVNYIAPYSEGEVTLTFKASDETAQMKVYVYKERVTGESVRAKVEDFSGNAAYKKADSEIWEPVTVGLELGEGDSILTMKDSYVVITFPNDSKTKVLDNTQLKIEKLIKTEKGYVIEMKQLKGKTYSSVKKLLQSGEKFVVKTDSVTAGVRGTKFSVIFENGIPTIATFEGVVFAYFRDGRVLPVPAGSEINPNMDRPGPSEYKEEDFTKAPEKEEKAGKEEVGKEEEKAQEKPPVQGAAPNVFMGTMFKDGKDYLMYSISYSLTIGPLWLDIGLTAYNSELGGDLYYGIPSATPSTNLLDIITLNGIGLTFGDSYFKYQLMPLYDLGMAFTMRGYTVPYARAVDVKLNAAGMSLYAHIPYELKKISSFEFGPSDSVWFGQFEMSLSSFNLFLSGVYDTEPATPENGQKPVSFAVMTGLKKDIIIGDVGVELALESATDSSMAYGIFGGYFGRFGVLTLTAGAYGSFAGFHPFLFGRDYYILKLQDAAPGIYSDGRAEMGYLAGGELNWTYAKGRLYLYGPFGGSPSLSGDARIIVPNISGAAFNGLFITGYIFDKTPFEGLLEKGGDTDAWLKVSYPIMGENLTAGFMFKWDSDTGEWKKLILVGADIWK